MFLHPVTLMPVYQKLAARYFSSRNLIQFLLRRCVHISLTVTAQCFERKVNLSGRGPMRRNGHHCSPGPCTCINQVIASIIESMETLGSVRQGRASLGLLKALGGKRQVKVLKEKKKSASKWGVKILLGVGRGDRVGRGKSRQIRAV